MRRSTIFDLLLPESKHNVPGTEERIKSKRSISMGMVLNAGVSEIPPISLSHASESVNFFHGIVYLGKGYDGMKVRKIALAMKLPPSPPMSKVFHMKRSKVAEKKPEDLGMSSYKTETKEFSDSYHIMKATGRATKVQNSSVGTIAYQT